MQADEEPLIQGWRIDRRFFESLSLRRCGLGECRAWCCGMGVWVDRQHAQTVHEHAELVKRYLPEDRQNPDTWFDGQIVDDADFPSGQCTGTNVVPRPDHPVEQACVFLRHDFRCALQMAGSENGMGRWGLKPYFCALHPLTYDEGRRVTFDDFNEVYIGGGSCQRINVTGEPLPLFEVMADELKLVLGDAGYAELAGLAKNGGSQA